MSLDVLTSEEAFDLLGRIAGAERITAQRDEAQEIVRLCGYLPLAVRVAGAQLAIRPTQTVRGLTARLINEKSRLSQLRVGDIEVRSSLAIGYSQQPPAERRLFGMLGGLRFADVPAWAVAALLGVDLATAERMADSLVDAGLLDAAGEDPAGQFRYRMHDLLRLIAREMTDRGDRAQRRAAETSMLVAYLKAARLAAALLDSTEIRGREPKAESTAGLSRLGVFQAIVVDPASWLRVELDNLTLAVEQAYDVEQWMIACELAITLTDYYDTYSLWEQWERSHSGALAAARRMGDRAIEADILWRLGRRYRHGRPDQALSTYDACIRLYRETGDRKGEASALLEAGVVHREQGSLAEAHRAYAACLLIFAELDDRHMQAHALRRLAFLETDQAAIPEAITHFQQSLAILEAFGDVRWIARTLRGLSIACRLMRLHADAEDAATRALAAFRAVDDDRGAGYALLDLGDLRAEQGRLDEASACCWTPSPYFEPPATNAARHTHCSIWPAFRDGRENTRRQSPAPHAQSRSARRFTIGAAPVGPTCAWPICCGSKAISRSPGTYTNGAMFPSTNWATKWAQPTYSCAVESSRFCSATPKVGIRHGVTRSSSMPGRTCRKAASSTSGSHARLRRQ